MAEDQGKEEEKFDFTGEGEAVNYISLDEARVLALRTASEDTDFYGPAYSDQGLVHEELDAEEGDDYYRVRLSCRPVGDFSGTPGVELFTIDKVGTIELRQLLSSPRPRNVMFPVLAGLGVFAVVGIVVVVLFTTGVFSPGGVTDMAGGSVTAPVPGSSMVT